MTKAVIIYDSKSGNTGMMAKAIGEGMKKAGIEVSSKRGGKRNCGGCQGC